MNSSYKLVAFSALVLAGFSCGQKPQSGQQAPAEVAVTTYTVVKKSVTATDEYSSTLVPINEVEIRPQISGYITDIYVQDGQQVKKGQKLYEIDRSKYAASQQQAQALVQSAEANLARVAKDFERYKRLDEQDAIAKQQLDYAETAVLDAKAQLSSAKAQYASAGTDFGYSVLTAPFDGTVGISQVRLGTQVSPGQPLLNTISSNDPMALNFVINEREIPRFNKMLGAEDNPDSLFRIRFSDNSIYPFSGKFTTIDRAVGRQTGTISLRVQFPNPNRELIAGMTVNLQVLNQDVGEQLTIPYKAVTEQMGEYFVYVVAEDQTVTQQVIKLGTEIGADIVVREGLTAGQEIVVSGIQKLRQGAKITTAAAGQQ
ncbi:membrane fusion protein (multidrug efflux system) [Algoriphagus ratkowskyi]|uniref:Efflux RND transporter periplasmic adaptor subunit n=1 Tax=Algoriphagus ratkowskyi TaxID=57028 RepID=A0A2W7RFT3_9BACT|nr:efflux RND transporter periplasmic adaptor subunit [Algoriphagus ratkowskyi]PZX53119.1 membrane fusion protein (multidrug efflux system) [Algoriphagus ratkowskyi]TXD76397.1 efflux RND transporter periplasmic adaptor subunit [Algoriphagus ratkowskyi]